MITLPIIAFIYKSVVTTTKHVCVSLFIAKLLTSNMRNKRVYPRANSSKVTYANIYLLKHITSNGIKENNEACWTF